MKNKQRPTTSSSGSSDDCPATIPKYCDRCARRSSALIYDDLSLRELCTDCWQNLTRRRMALQRPENI
jgi:hypothetical protein